MSRLSEGISAGVVGIAFLMVCARTHVGAQQPTGTRTEHEAVYRCDTPGIQLEGTLAERMFYGPPGFGETPAKDLHDKVLVLKLANPITVEPIHNAEAKNSTSLSTLKHVRQIQLFFGDSRSSEADARKLLGRHVVAVGSLKEATVPRQYTDVTMDVKALTSR